MWETSRLSSLLVPRAWTCLSNTTESLLVVEMKFTVRWRASLECHKRAVSLDITKLSAQKGCYACAGSALPPWAAFAATHVLYIPLLYMRWVEQRVEQPEPSDRPVASPEGCGEVAVRPDSRVSIDKRQNPVAHIDRPVARGCEAGGINLHGGLDCGVAGAAQGIVCELIVKEKSPLARAVAVHQE